MENLNTTENKNKNYKFNNEDDLRLSYDPSRDLNVDESDISNHISDENVRELCEKLGSFSEKKLQYKPAGFTYHEYVKSKFFVCFLSRSMIMRVTHFKFKTYHYRYLERTTLDCTVKKFGDATVCIIWEKQWKGQIGFREITNSIYGAVKAPIIFLDSIRSTIKSITSMTMRLLLLDLTSFLINLKEGNFTGEKLVSSMLSIYTMHYRFTEYWEIGRWKSQSSTTITDVLLGLTALGLPTKVIESIKTFTTITGKRIFESDVLMTTLHSVFEALITILEHMSQPVLGYVIVPEAVTKSLIEIIKKLGGSLFIHAEIKNICNIYSKYVTNPQSLFDPSFRSEIMSIHSKLKGNPDFLDYINNANNRYFKTTWDLFEANVVKSCKAFDTSGRDEPICFVFEGGAGSGKSAFMNSFVSLLVRSGLTTYCHSVPAAEDGKDFYDDYENQDVFVMDDVGQQGKSQWRYLINFVSPVKYPLPCATASKKNTKFFNSKIILCTTNHFSDLTGFTSSDCISEPSALFRRAHLIKITRSTENGFSQLFSYMKYDHIGSNKWEQGFINHFAVGLDPELKDTLDTSDLPNVEQRTIASLKWMFRVYNHILDCEESNRLVLNLPTDILDDIIHEVTPYEDATREFAPQFNILKSLRNSFTLAKDTVLDVALLLDEYIGYLMLIIGKHMKQYLDMVKLFVEDELPKVFKGLNLNMMYLFGGIMGLAVVAFLGYFLGNREDIVNTPEFIQSNLDLNSYCLEAIGKLDAEYKSFSPQTESQRDRFEQRMSEIQSSCRTLVLREMNGLPEENTQCIVSGNFVLTPAHMKIEGRLVNMYRTWEHYKNEHVEFENLKLKLVRSYFASDLCIYNITTVGPVRYPKTSIFNAMISPLGSLGNTKDLYLVNSTGFLRLEHGVHVQRNNEKVVYSTVSGKWSHEPGSGFYTPFSASGGCGTILVTPSAGAIAFHVAGASNVGFCIQPPKQTFEDIVKVMHDTQGSNFVLRPDIQPGISGVRIQYDGRVDQVLPTSETSITKSVFHTDFNNDVLDLIKEVETSDRIEGNPATLTTAPKDKIEAKAPPNFHSQGTPRKTLLAMAKKTFKHQGVITDDELEFMRQYLRSVMVEFNDVPDEEVAFGNEHLPPFSKTSSNGVGCTPLKSDYFDFENKKIKPAMYELIEKVRKDAESKSYDPSLFTSRESFKDELRKLSKVDAPRTVRVMPLGHTFWCKKIFGNLLKHFKLNRMKTGISVGYNPYKDGDILAKLLLSCDILGDADFGKWDGSIMALILALIIEVMGEFYIGNYNYFIEWFIFTISNSFVLINDELWWTTHGLPSGCWLTLLINCLINKCLTALVIYRNKPNPTVEDVHRVVDFVTGDDKVIGADTEMGKYFNLETIKAVALSLGMDCTNGDKSPITKATQDFDKLTYVKRHFRKHPVLGRYVGVLSLETILNTIQWINTDTSDEHIAMLGKCRAMQVEAYLHSPLFYRKLTNVFEKYFPFDPFFTEERVRKILDDDAGYAYVTNLKNGQPQQ
jgi:hypothetical protein